MKMQSKTSRQGNSAHCLRSVLILKLNCVLNSPGVKLLEVLSHQAVGGAPAWRQRMLRRWRRTNVAAAEKASSMVSYH